MEYLPIVFKSIAKMDDKDFCIEYVKRIPRPTRSKFERQMVQVVEQKIRINKADMFNDSAINHLFHGNSDITRFVYAFIRDNQELF